MTGRASRRTRPRWARDPRVDARLHSPRRVEWRRAHFGPHPPRERNHRPPPANPAGSATSL